MNNQMNKPSMTTATAATTAPTTSADRSQLLHEAISMTMSTAYGIQRLNENQIGQVLGNLVRSKLLSADDSYKLRDQLLDPSIFEKALDERVEANLRRKGVISEQMVQGLKSRIQELERKVANA